jgi:hypothetical protein
MIHQMVCLAEYIFCEKQIWTVEIESLDLESESLPHVAWSQVCFQRGLPGLRAPRTVLENPVEGHILPDNKLELLAPLIFPSSVVGARVIFGCDKTA